MTCTEYDLLGGDVENVGRIRVRGRVPEGLYGTSSQTINLLLMSITFIHYQRGTY